MKLIKEWDEFDSEDEIDDKWIPVISEKNLAAYVSESEMIEFIVKNSDIGWNQCCQYVRFHGITGDEGHIYWDKNILNNQAVLNEHQIKWISAFFNAHPFIERMVLVFDE